MRTLIRIIFALWITSSLVGAIPLDGQASSTSHVDRTVLNEASTRNLCSVDPELFPLKQQALSVINADGGVLFTAGMTIDADGAPNAYGPRKKYIDATRIPYIALPSDFAKRFDINLGDLAVVVNRTNGRSAYAVFADVGPRGRIGEGSIALARALGIPANPRHDSAVDGITYLIFPSSSLAGENRITAHTVKFAAARLYRHWGGTQKLRTCELLVADTKQ